MAPLPPLTAPMEPGDFAAGQRAAFEDKYRILPGDILRIKFAYHQEFDIKTPVRQDGSIALIDFGTFRAEGRTAEELAEEIRVASSEYLRDPQVSVIVAEVGAHKVYVGGEVRNPGFVLYRDGMTPLQAIVDRGGFTDTARIDSVLKVSSYRHGVPRTTRLDFGGTIKEGDPELNALRAYDVIYVPQTFIGDANMFVRLYIRNMIPIPFRTGVGFAP